MTSPLGLLSCVCLSMGAATGVAHANPEGGVVTRGSATIDTPDSKTTRITQSSNRVVIDWRKFNIEVDETTEFIQPGSNAIAVNRVNSADPSRILGKLQANGNVAIINQSGVYFGKDATVDVGGLVATTHQIDDDELMASGKLILQGNAASQASVINDGQITARDAGLVGLVAPHVENNGKITARLGQVALASGTKATIDFYGDGLLSIATDEGVTAQSVKNKGIISADGGKVVMTAAAARSVVDNLVENSGTISARSVGVKNGKIILSAAGVITQGKSKAVNKGTLDVSGKATSEKGGQVDILGDFVHLAATAHIDASGDAGGGKVRIGGDYQGSGDTPKATTTYIESGATISADAITDGNGGDVYVWSDGGTWYYGAISVRGGNSGGNGGFVEVSGKKYLDFQGDVDTRAPQGINGHLLLDPTNITISNAVNTQVTGTTPFEPLADDVTSILNVSTLQTAMQSSNVTVQTRSTGSQLGDIVIDDQIYSTDNSNSYTLTLDAAHDIIVNYGVTYDDMGSLNFIAGNDIIINGYLTTISGGIDLRAGNDLIINGSITSYYNNMSLRFGHDIAIGASLYADSYYGIQTTAAGLDLGINGGAGSAQLSAAELAFLDSTKTLLISGFDDVVIGAGSINPLDITTASGGSITVAGDITTQAAVSFITDEIDIAGIITSATPSSIIFTLSNVTAGVNIGIGDGQSGALHLSDAEMANIRETYGYNIRSLGASDINLGETDWGSAYLTLNTAGDIHINGDQTISNQDITIYNANLVDIQADISGVKNLIISSVDDVNITGSVTGNGSGALTVQSNGTLGLGNGTGGDMHLDTAELNRISGFGTQNYTASLGTSTATIAAHTWNQNVVFDTNGITFTGDQTVNGDMSIDIGTGTLTLGSNDLTGTGTLTLSSSDTMGVGDGAAGARVITNSDLNHIEDGWSELAFTSTNNIQVAARTWSNSVKFTSYDTLSILGAQDVGSHNMELHGTTDTSIAGNLTGTGNLTIGMGVGSVRYIGSATGPNNLTTTELGYIQSGWNQVILGNTNSGYAQYINGYNWSTKSFANGIKFQNNTGNIVFQTGTHSFGTNNVEVNTRGLVDLNSSLTGTGAFTFSSPSNMRIGNTTGVGYRISLTDMSSYLTNGGWSAYNIVNTGATSTVNVFGTTNWNADLTIDAAGVITTTGIQNFGANDFTIRTNSNPTLGGNLNGTGIFTLESKNKTANFEIGSAAAGTAGLIGITSAEISTLTNGWSKIVIGGSTETGTMKIGATTWNDPAHFITTGDLTIEGNVTSADATAEQNKLVFKGDSFTNSTGTASINAGSGRYLVYSSDPSGDSYGTITRATKRYNKTYAGYAPTAVTETGNVFLYSVAPIIDVTVDNQSREYGQANPAFTYTLDTADLIDGDTAGSAVTSSTVSSAANLTSNVGNYAITATMLSDLGYQFNVTDGTLSITKAMLTATTSSATREYGLSNPALTVSYTGFRNGEDSSVIDTLATASTAATLTSDVGNYATTASGGLDNNYDFTYVAGNLSITQATLQAIANDLSRQYGVANPALTISYTGFRNGDTASVLDTAPTLATAATTSSGLGTYAITIGGGVDTNYNIVHTGGNLTIGKKDLSVSVADVTIRSGNIPSYTISYSGFVLGDDVLDLTSPAVATDNAPSYNTDGRYTISLSGLLSSVYNPIYTNGNLFIESIPVVPDSVTRVISLPETLIPQSSAMDFTTQIAETAGYGDQFTAVIDKGSDIGNSFSNAPLGTMLFIRSEIADFYGTQDLDAGVSSMDTPTSRRKEIQL